MGNSELKKITIEDIAAYKFPGNPTYSPDGKYLAFTVTRSDLDKNLNRSDVYVASEGKYKQLTYTIDAGIVAWEDDKTLIIRRKTEDSPSPMATQLFKIDVTGGEAQPWITLPFPMNRLVRIAENSYACIGQIDARTPDLYKATKEEQAKYAEEKKNDEDYQVVDEVPYWFNGAGYTNKIRSALFLLDTSDGVKLERMTAPFFNAGNLVCEKGILYFTGSEYESRMVWTDNLYCLDPAKKEIKAIYDKNDLSMSTIFFLGDEMFVRATDMKDYGINQTQDICKVAADGTIEIVYMPDITIGNGVVTDTVHGSGRTYAYDSRKFVTIETEVDHNLLCSYDKNFNCTVLMDMPGMMDAMAMSKKTVAIIYQDWKHVAEIFEFDLKTGSFRQLTHLNDNRLEGKYIAKPHPVTYTSTGLKHRGWVLLPDGFEKEKKYPSVLDIHGGPRGSYGETFFHEMQLWASEGYIVYFCNIRGSDGRGDEYADIRGLYGEVDFKNLMDFTDAVLKRYPQIDTEKMCVTGGSYGGFMTNWVIGHTDRFCRAASQRSISNWISMSTISDIGLVFGPDQCAADDIFSDPARLWYHSPLKYAKNAKTPTLFIHSTDDYRCPLPEGMQMMQALAFNGVETRLVIFKGENHELSRSGKPKHRMRRLKEITDWFNKHI